MATTSDIPTADTQMSFYDNVLGPARWSGKHSAVLVRALHELRQRQADVMREGCAYALWLGTGADLPLKPLNLERV